MKMVAWMVGNRGKWWLGGSEIEENGGLEGRKLRKIVFWQGLARTWGASWDLWCDFPEISAEVGGKMGASWAKLAASCGQDGP